MKKQELPSWRDCCIYRVPKTLRKIKPEAFSPRLISLGPLKTPLQERTDEPPVQDETVKMETVKLKYLEKFYERTERNLEELLKIVEKQEERIRRCYEEIDVKDDVEFRERILVDSVFIIELFLKEKEPKEHVYDFIVGKPWLRTAVQEDLILLENQLPYFILDELYKFIDCLIDTDKDVDFLIDKGILVNGLGDSEMVAKLFNDLCKEIIEDEFCFETIRQKLYDHYGNCWYRTVAIMRHVYFSNIFRGSGTIVAIMLLIFTLIQFINSLMEIF
ncbi:hypothetical protein GH714_042348 [Hevea brasiliensis]|uniref:DUF247 domain protein n=1 Tax=Hevea brasiliensis TaxID=3981 RepID=A0A6A6KB16_HEVBR|nr:hypothetical protein GH714_042348 [Hevea brasiliensis]